MRFNPKVTRRPAVESSSKQHDGTRKKCTASYLGRIFGGRCCPSQLFLDDLYFRLTCRVRPRGPRGPVSARKTRWIDGERRENTAHCRATRSRYFQTKIDCCCTCTHARNAFSYYSWNTTPSVYVSFTITARVSPQQMRNVIVPFEPVPDDTFVR